jgi:hypothetical protein
MYKQMKIRRLFSILYINVARKESKDTLLLSSKMKKTSKICCSFVISMLYMCVCKRENKKVEVYFY